MEEAWWRDAAPSKHRRPSRVQLLRARGTGTVETGSPRDKILLVIEQTPVLDRCTETRSRVSTGPAGEPVHLPISSCPGRFSLEPPQGRLIAISGDSGVLD